MSDDALMGGTKLPTDFLTVIACLFKVFTSPYLYCLREIIKKCFSNKEY